MTTQQLAASLNVTPRRIRQLAEDDVIVRIGQGRFHFTQAVWASIALKTLNLSPEDRRNVTPIELSAAGWLHGFSVDKSAVTHNDRDRWALTCKECGHKDPEAVLMAATALLGNRAPRFAPK